MNQQEATCRTCPWSSPKAGNASYLECRVDPPRPATIASNRGVFTLMEPNDWCGRHPQRREPVVLADAPAPGRKPKSDPGPKEPAPPAAEKPGDDGLEKLTRFEVQELARSLGINAVPATEKLIAQIRAKRAEAKT